jgi:flagellar export protein FliJ
VSARRRRLDAVLRVRRFQLDRAGAELGAALRQLRDARARCEALAREATLAAARIVESGRGGVAAGWLRAAAAGAQGLAAHTFEAYAEAERAGRAVTAARARTLEARRRVRGLEKLRERQERQWREERARGLQRELDEMGVRASRAGGPT